jgi:hypothetical protein
MSYYRHLNLPNNPIRYIPDVPSLAGDHIKCDPKKTLTDEVLGIFDNLNLVPSQFIFFCRANKEVDATNRVIHYDIVRTDPKPWTESDPVDKKTWKKAICGLNWEVTGSHCEFSWWNMDAVKPAPPERTGIPIKFDYLNSVHYVKRGTFGIPEGAIKLDQVLLTARPTLLRTELPHLTTYHGDNIRIGASLRFEETWNSWEEAVEKFKPLYF